MSVTPQRGAGTASLGISHWGTSFVTGRGLVALSAPGYIYPVTLAAGEELVVHPSHVVAYAVNKQGAPQPFRLRSAKGVLTSAAEAAAGAVSSAASTTAQITAKAVKGLRFQAPKAPATAGAVATTDDSLSARWSRFWSAMQTTSTYRFVSRALFDARTVLRRTIWGDRLFVRVQGPTTLLLSSRGVRVSDVLTRDNVNEIADADAGVVAEAISKKTKSSSTTEGGDKPATSSTDASTTAIHVAEVKANGKVEFTDAKDLKEFVR